jgi:homopolymeric O-antigen transport system ATP-binding protein
MTSPTIIVENLSKRYRIGVREEHNTLREMIMGLAAEPFRRLRRFGQSSHHEEDSIWAVKDVSFEVQPGEIVGIIGCNGAGKSTLLKILTRITEPTTGRAILKGRVGSLLEVGTGFHSELTGWENIYLSGSILGMKKRDIAAKFDEIVAFSGVEKFIDTPVKRYSSGMKVRLGFAVAAHLQPEILLIDEVLAVGDVEFQKQCLGKMDEVAKSGRTVLFVSHNMVAITNLCNRCILIEKGEISASGTPREMVDRYLSGPPRNISQKEHGEFDLTDRQNPYLPGELIIRKVRLLDSRGNAQDKFRMGEEMDVVIEIEGMSAYHDALIGVIFESRDNQRLTGINTGMKCSYIEKSRQKKELAILRVPRVPFTPGLYGISVGITHGKISRIDFVEHQVHFEVIEADVYGTGYNVTPNHGIFYLNADWEIRSHT